MQHFSLLWITGSKLTLESLVVIDVDVDHGDNPDEEDEGDGLPGEPSPLVARGTHLAPSVEESLQRKVVVSL